MYSRGAALLGVPSAAKESLGSVHMDTLNVLCCALNAGVRHRDGAPAPGQVWWVPAWIYSAASGDEAAGLCTGTPPLTGKPSITLHDDVLKC